MKLQYILEHKSRRITNPSYGSSATEAIEVSAVPIQAIRDSGGPGTNVASHERGCEVLTTVHQQA